MAKRFLPLLIGDEAPPLRPPAESSLRRRASKRNPPKSNPPKTPLRGGKRGKRGGTVKPTGKFEHLRVRAPQAFTKGSLKTVPWIFVDARERAFVQKKLGLRAIPSGTKVITGHLKDTVTRDRVPGAKVKWLASGVQSVLVPIRGGKTPKSPPGTRKLPKRKAQAVKARAARPARRNPGRLAILANPQSLPREVTACAAAMRGPKRARFLAFAKKLSAHDQARLAKGLALYRKRHKAHCTDFELKKVPGTHTKIEVGVGRAQAIEYHANKGYEKSSKRGTPWRHRFENGQHVVSDENGRHLEVVDRRGAKRKTITTDFIRN